MSGCSLVGVQSEHKAFRSGQQATPEASHGRGTQVARTPRACKDPAGFSSSLKGPKILLGCMEQKQLLLRKRTGAENNEGIMLETISPKLKRIDQPLATNAVCRHFRSTGRPRARRSWRAQRFQVPQSLSARAAHRPESRHGRWWSRPPEAMSTRACGVRVSPPRHKIPPPATGPGLIPPQC